MLIATRGGDREIETRQAEWGAEHLIPSPGGNLAVLPEMSASLPAVGAAIRLISGTIASLALRVYEGEGADKKERQDSWQYRLFEHPGLVSGYTFMWDVVSGLESCGNAYIFKSKMRRQVGTLTTLHPANVKVRRDFNTQELIYEFWDGKQMQRIPNENLVHIRGDTLGGGDQGFSPLQMHAMSLGTFLKRQSFEGQHFSNAARPGVALMFPQEVTLEQARQWVEEWDARHAGPHNVGRTGVLGGGADIKDFPISLEEQEWVEGQRFSVEEVERMYDLPPGTLQANEAQSSEQESLRLLKRLQPRMRRLEEAFEADPDLFGRDSRLYPQFRVDDLLRTDAVSMAQVMKEKVQAGVWTPNEARAQDGLPKAPPQPKDPLQNPGDVLQITPVGGAPNPSSAPPED